MGVANDRLGSKRSVLLEVLLETGGAVVADELGVDSLRNDLGSKRSRCASAHAAAEDDRDLLRSANVEVISDAALEEPAS